MGNSPRSSATPIRPTEAIRTDKNKFTPEISIQSLILTYHASAGSKEPTITDGPQIVGTVSKELFLQKRYYTLDEVFLKEGKEAKAIAAKLRHTKGSSTHSNTPLLRTVEDGLSAVATELREEFARDRGNKHLAKVFGVCGPEETLPGLVQHLSTHNTDGCDRGGIDPRALSKHARWVCLDFFTAVEGDYVLGISHPGGEKRADGKRDHYQGWLILSTNDRDTREWLMCMAHDGTNVGYTKADRKAESVSIVVETTRKTRRGNFRLYVCLSVRPTFETKQMLLFFGINFKIRDSTLPWTPLCREAGRSAPSQSAPLAGREAVRDGVLNDLERPER